MINCAVNAVYCDTKNSIDQNKELPTNLCVVRIGNNVRKSATVKHVTRYGTVAEAQYRNTKPMLSNIFVTSSGIARKP